MNLLRYFCKYTLPIVMILIILGFSNTYYVTAASSAISDEASLLTDSQCNKLEEKIQSIYKEHTINVRIFTVNSLEGKSDTRYLDQIEDQLNIKNAIFILIDMSIDDTSNRAFYISRYDEYTEKYFSQKRLDDIRDTAIAKLKDLNYMGALEDVLNKIDVYADTSAASDNLLFQSWFQLIICLIIAIIIVSCMVVTSGGKTTTTTSTYLNEDNSRVLGRYDHYIRTTVTRVKIENNNNNSNHTTSGGHSSSSSSGHF